MKIKTATMTGPVLDWAVAKALGACAAEPSNNPLLFKWDVGAIPHYSTVWAQGGPLIERERIWVCAHLSGNGWFSEGSERHEGPTPLIAAMRCYVATKLGEEVDVPEELDDRTPEERSQRAALGL